MESNLFNKAENDIEYALDCYGKHTWKKEVLEDVSDTFIARLARDSVNAKQDLRELFRKSPVWDEELQALIINGTRTHNPDYSRIRELAYRMTCDAWQNPFSVRYDTIQQALWLFAVKNLEENDHETSINAINELAPGAYVPGKKLSRVFRDLCRGLGVWDDTAGSDFQKDYAKFADELTAKQIDFKLFVSCYAPYFLTMSNPKSDERGPMLTSCHSFNCTDYSYNCGCTGYARDAVTFIVFTVENPHDKESLFNRKTTRQIFAYRPGSGILLQSRMYNTSGGTCGANELTPLYRDLIQREISALEDKPNLWRTKASYNGDFEHLVKIGYGFGGYADWTYSDFDGHISVRADCDLENAQPLVVGTYGLCVKCGEETSEGVYCGDCNETEICDDCDEPCSERFLVYNPHGSERWVCENCRENNYTCCDGCGDYHDNECITWVGDYAYCDDCRDRRFECCDQCGEWEEREEMTRVHDRNGYEAYVCPYCLERHYTQCEECGEYYKNGTLVAARDENGNEIYICRDCAKNYETCENCGELVRPNDDGTCPNCGENVVKEKEVMAVC